MLPNRVWIVWTVNDEVFFMFGTYSPGSHFGALFTADFTASDHKMYSLHHGRTFLETTPIATKYYTAPDCNEAV